MGWIDRQTGGTLAGLLDQMLDVEGRVGSHHNCRTGFHPFDEILDGGLRTGDLAVIGGRPGCGKTAMTLQWALSAALAGYPTIVASLEHDPSDVLERLLLIVAGDEPIDDRPLAGDLRPVLARVLEGTVSWEAASSRFPGLARARATVESAADNFHLLCGASTNLEELGDLAVKYGDGPKLVVIDYLQKVASHSHDHDVDAVTRDAKGLALTTGSAVVAISSMDRPGIEAQRLRMSHLRGAQALSYEADLVVMLDSKLNTVSKLHTQFDDLKRREFAEWSVLTVEKNRRGPAGLGLEFRRDLAFSRFDPEGGIVSERLEESMGVVV